MLATETAAAPAARAFRMTFRPSPRAAQNIAWTRCYVAEIGDDAANHARAAEVMRDAYPGAQVVSVVPTVVGSGAQ